MSNNNKKEEISDQAFGMLMFGLILLGVCKNLNRIEYWFYEHRFLLITIAASVIYGTVKFLRWRFKMKHPEIYERQLAIKAMQYRRAQTTTESQGRRPSRSGEVYIGYTMKDRKSLVLTNDDRAGQVQIVGATGRGKTRYVILPWYLQDIDNGNVPILIDGKGDTDIAERIKQKYESDPLRGPLCYFDLSNPDESWTINPLEGDSATEVADRLIASLEFESAYFRDVQHAVALMFFEIMSWCGEPFTLERLYQCLTVHAEVAVMLSGKRIPEELMDELKRYQALSSRDREERYSGLISQLRPFATGEMAKLVNGDRHDNKYLCLERLMLIQKDEAKPAAAILLNTMKYQKSAKILGKMIIQTLAWATSSRTGREAFVPIFLDEFSAFVYDGFEQFQNKARSYGVALHLSHQSLGDLEKISDSFAKTVNVNTNVKVLLGLNDPETADYYAKHIGTKTAAKRTERGKAGAFGSLEMTGDMSIRNVEEYKIHPNRLRNYSQGVGVLSLLVAGIPVTEEVQFRGAA